jgi:predicted small metal-binding protein
MAKHPGSPIGSGTNPSVNPDDGGVNPSAPSAGTEGWGMTSDERRVLTEHDPKYTHAGQMKGNPGDHMTEASNRASHAATTNKKPDHRSNEHGDLSRRTSISAHSVHTNQQSAVHTFRCADAGNSDCDWETSGKSEEEVMEKVVEHAREGHGMTDWTDAMHNRVRDAIRHHRAA